jgi:hypothetical protein
MARKPPKEAGSDFLSGVLARISDDKKDAVKLLLADEAVLEEIGGGVLRQDDYSRHMNELTSWRGELDEWYKTNQEALAAFPQLQGRIAELEAARQAAAAEPTDPPIQTPAVDLSGYMKSEDVAKLLSEREAQAVALMSRLTTLASHHSHEFKEPLDTDKIVVHARKTGLPVEAAYADMVKERREKTTAEQRAAELAAAERRGAEKARREMSSPTPYPVGNAEPTTLSGLNADAGAKAAFGLDAAVRAYHDGQAQRNQ